MKRKLTEGERRDADAAQQAYHSIAADLTDAVDVVASKMFGMPCIKVRGKAAAGLYHESMTFKLTGEAHALALALPGAKLFDPSGMNRPMKEWVQVPYAQRAHWKKLAEASVDYLLEAGG